MSELITLFERGGVLMYPLLLLSIVALWIFLERLYHLRRANSRPESLFDEVNTLLLRGERKRALHRAREGAGPVAAVFAAVLQQPSGEKADLEELAAMQGRKELKRLTRRLPLLSLIAGIAPLIGLLGTVLGLVKAFQKVATAQGVVNPSLLADGIWEALLTTVAGLMIAIPAALFHHYLDQKVKAYTFEINHYGTMLIRLLAATEDVHAGRGH
jgi:biopolymer transport protein ExbB